jgi:hypothetical protein
MSPSRGPLPLPQSSLRPFLGCWRTLRRTEPEGGSRWGP